MAMEYLRGQSLMSEIEKNGPMSEAEGLLALAFLAEPLKTIHEAGVLHRDINPSNIIDCDDRMVLIDFGLTKPLEKTSQYGTRRLSPTSSFGTEGYAPIEQYSNASLAEPATDIYSLAATLYFLITGQAPIPAPERAAGRVMAAPHEVVPAIGRAFSRAILRAMEMDMRLRPQTVNQFVDDCLSSNPSAGAVGSAGGTVVLAPNSNSFVTTQPITASPVIANSLGQTTLTPAQLQSTLQSVQAALAITPVTDSDVAAPSGFVVDTDAPLNPALLVNTQLNLPTVVRISARIIDWPFECPCCGGAPDARFLSGFVEKRGRRVIRQPTNQWTVPLCAICVQHYALRRESQRWAQQAANALQREKALQANTLMAVPAPRYPSPPEPLPYPAQLPMPVMPAKPNMVEANFVTNGWFYGISFIVIWYLCGGFEQAVVWTALLAGFLIPMQKGYIWSFGAEAEEAWQQQVRSIEEEHEKQLAISSQNIALDNMEAMQKYQENVRQIKIDYERDCTRQRDQHAQDVSAAHKDVETGNFLAAELDTLACQPGHGNCCPHPAYAVIHADHAGSVHTFVFANNDYATRFVTANSDKVIFNERRPVEFPST